MYISLRRSWLATQRCCFHCDGSNKDVVGSAPYHRQGSVIESLSRQYIATNRHFCQRFVGDQWYCVNLCRPLSRIRRTSINERVWCQHQRTLRKTDPYTKSQVTYQLSADAVYNPSRFRSWRTLIIAPLSKNSSRNWQQAQTSPIRPSATPKNPQNAHHQRCWCEDGY